MAGLTPFVLTAVLQQGVAVDLSRGIALDGLLASLVRRERGNGLPGSLLDGGLDVGEPTEWELPLARCDYAADWHWLASVSEPVGVGPGAAPVVDAHRLMVRLDDRRASHTAVRVPVEAGGTRGRYRTRVSPVLVTPAVALRWTGVGDVDEVVRLVRPVPSVGGRRGSGEGAVLRWEIETVDALDADAFGHVRQDGTLVGPVPLECADRYAARDWVEGIAGIRPPSFHRARQRTLAVPVPSVGR